MPVAVMAVGHMRMGMAQADMGMAMAVRLAGRVLRIVAVPVVQVVDMADINDEAGEAVVAASGGKAAYFRCDIAQEEDVKALVAQTLAAFGGLDGAFNNAAIPKEIGR